jgi:hypothetical protein
MLVAVFDISEQGILPVAIQGLAEENYLKIVCISPIKKRMPIITPVPRAAFRYGMRSLRRLNAIIVSAVFGINCKKA